MELSPEFINRLECVFWCHNSCSKLNIGHIFLLYSFIINKLCQPKDIITTQNFNWKDTWSFKFGTEYFVKDTVSIRGGYANHQSPSPDETLNPIFPALPQQIISLGIGYDGPMRSITDQSLMGKLAFDAFIQYVISGNRTSTLPDYTFSYSGNYFILGFGVGLNF